MSEHGPLVTDVAFDVNSGMLTVFKKDTNLPEGEQETSYTTQVNIPSAVIGICNNHDGTINAQHNDGTLTVLDPLSNLDEKMSEAINRILLLKGEPSQDFSTRDKDNPWGHLSEKQLDDAILIHTKLIEVMMYELDRRKTTPG